MEYSNYWQRLRRSLALKSRKSNYSKTASNSTELWLPDGYQEDSEHTRIRQADAGYTYSKWVKADRCEGFTQGLFLGICMALLLFMALFGPGEW